MRGPPTRGYQIYDQVVAPFSTLLPAIKVCHCVPGTRDQWDVLADRGPLCQYDDRILIDRVKPERFLFVS